MSSKREFACAVIATALASVIVMLAAAGTNAETIGYWRFEGDDTGFVADSSGNGFTLTKGDGSDPGTYPTQVMLPDSGVGAHFDGPVPQSGLANAKAADLDNDRDFFYCADDPMFSVSDFTIEAYVNHRTATEYPEVIAAQYAGSYDGEDNQRGWSLCLGSGIFGAEALYLYVSDDGSNATKDIVYSGLDVPLETDCYVAASFDESEQEGGVNFYVKNLSTGEWQTATADHTVDSLHDPIAPFQIGAYAGDVSPGREFDGLIDEVRWSNSVLTQNELLAVPEPTSFVLLGIGLASLFCFGWLRRNGVT